MKKYILILLALLAFVPAINADDKKDKQKMLEEIQNFKIDFLSKEMNLTEAEKAKFVPLYTEYDNARRKAGAEAWRFERSLKKKKDATDEDYKKLTELQQSAREKGAAIEKEYNKKFEKFLSARQIYQMRQGEEKFFSKMKEMRKKHRKGDPGHRNGPRPPKGERPGAAPGSVPPPPFPDMD